MRTETEWITVPSRGQAVEDDLLVTRCKLGEQRAFDELIDRWHVPLWRYARRLTGDDEVAAEMVQDVWLRVLRGIVRLRDHERLRAWLFGIARRVVMDRLREVYAAPATEAIDLSTIAAEEDDGRDLELEISALHEELDRLPVIEREVLALFYLQELSLKDLAEVLGVPVGTVKSRLFRARSLLRHQLTMKGIDR
jgi:RNA polymerase sigma factor (sigma-70 family)